MFDVVVLGGGPAGVTAALRARELGASVALIERGQLGGTCTNDGCVPTRVLAHAARLLRDSKQFEDYGLMLSGPVRVDFKRVLQRSQEVVYQVHQKKQLFEHLTEVGVDVRINAGDAHFIDEHTIATNHGEVQGKNIIICVGGQSRRLPIPGAEYALTSSDVWLLDELPESVAVVGAGATGCQLAYILQEFGAQVTLMDIAPRILMAEDSSISETVAFQLEWQGMNVLTGLRSVEAIHRVENGSGYKLTYTKADGSAQTLDVAGVIFATGWPGNADVLNLAAAGIERNRSYVKVDANLQTSVPHIYAAGDITGRIMLVQTAGYQARVAVENALLGAEKAAKHKLVPHGGFTNPQYASVGITEELAGPECIVEVVPYADLDRAVIDDRKTGFCKLIVDMETRQIVGAHVVGEQAVEVVQIVAAGMAGGVPIETLAELEFAYPTFAALIGLAAREITRKLEIMQVAPEWRALKEVRGAEWERTDA